MKLQTIEEYRCSNFQTPPDPRTIKKWCEKGAIAARLIAGHWYVVGNGEVSKSNKVDSLVNKILNG